MIILPSVVLGKCVTQVGIDFGVHIGEGFQVLLDFSQHLKGVMVLAQVEFLLRLSNLAEEDGILLAGETSLCFLKEFDGVFQIYL